MLIKGSTQRYLVWQKLSTRFQEVYRMCVFTHTHTHTHTDTHAHTHTHTHALCLLIFLSACSSAFLSTSYKSIFGLLVCSIILHFRYFYTLFPPLILFFIYIYIYIYIYQRSPIVILRNMVSAADVDTELQGEVASECVKYGDVEQVVVYQEHPEVSLQVCVGFFFLRFKVVLWHIWKWR